MPNTRNYFLKPNIHPLCTCATCHVKQFEEWSVSQHAYAQLSVVFNAMQTKININSGGTNGDFCIRCHTPLGIISTNPSISPISRARQLLGKG